MTRKIKGKRELLQKKFKLYMNYEVWTDLVQFRSETVTVEY